MSMLKRINAHRQCNHWPALLKSPEKKFAASNSQPLIHQSNRTGSGRLRSQSWRRFLSSGWPMMASTFKSLRILFRVTIAGDFFRVISPTLNPENRRSTANSEPQKPWISTPDG
ncbi:MAG: hypothetical protein VW834_03150, partial [Synechococcus sp.]